MAHDHPSTEQKRWAASQAMRSVLEEAARDRALMRRLAQAWFPDHADLERVARDFATSFVGMAGLIEQRIEKMCRTGRAEPVNGGRDLQ